jgi:hypothetical protein
MKKTRARPKRKEDKMNANQGTADFAEVLRRFPAQEREAWIQEVKRLAQIVEAYGAIKKKRRLRKETGRNEFVPEVMLLCKAARCEEPSIVSREPHRARQPSPHTLDAWYQAYIRDGPKVFLRSPPQAPPDQVDHRYAKISKSAIDYINQNWRSYQSPYTLYRNLKEGASKSGWVIPSRSWLYRRWQQMPEIVRITHTVGLSAYESKYAPFVPRDYSKLAALQVLCGDHSERDVTVLLEPEQRLVRPWLTVWQDLLTGLIWGWYLDLAPSSETASLAYADGLLRFGAQPFSRPEENFFSYIYTDHGRTYKSHNWDGKVIAVHQEAMQINDKLEMLLVEKQVGITDDFQIKHLLGRAGNAKERAVERFFKDLSEWEKNRFKEYCGKDAKSRPDLWYELYGKHQRYKRSDLAASPFLLLEDYREALAKFIEAYNASPHERSTLGGRKVIPLEEYRQGYPTRYEISRTTVALLLMKATSRTIGKDGVNCFRKNWWYLHPDMSLYKGAKVEVRYTDRDYNSVWVMLPNTKICEATLITPTELLYPNKETLKAVAQARARERKAIRDFHLITQSELRGETTEERFVTQLFHQGGEDSLRQAQTGVPARVHRLTRFDQKKLSAVEPTNQITAADVESAALDESIFHQQVRGRLREFDFDDGLDQGGE